MKQMTGDGQASAACLTRCAQTARGSVVPVVTVAIAVIPVIIVATIVAAVITPIIVPPVVSPARVVTAIMAMPATVVPDRHAAAEQESARGGQDL